MTVVRFSWVTPGDNAATILTHQTDEACGSQADPNYSGKRTDARSRAKTRLNDGVNAEEDAVFGLIRVGSCWRRCLTNGPVHERRRRQEHLQTVSSAACGRGSACSAALQRGYIVVACSHPVFGAGHAEEQGLLRLWEMQSSRDVHGGVAERQLFIKTLVVTWKS